jgi:hypothetical protein
MQWFSNLFNPNFNKSSSANVLWRTPLFRLSRQSFLSDGGSAYALPSVMI